VDYVSIGEITKHIKAIDLSMRFQKWNIAAYC
jgi:nicotinate-nucleotide pyrophosphorylase